MKKVAIIICNSRISGAEGRALDIYSNFIGVKNVSLYLTKRLMVELKKGARRSVLLRNEVRCFSDFWPIRYKPLRSLMTAVILGLRLKCEGVTHVHFFLAPSVARILARFYSFKVIAEVTSLEVANDWLAYMSLERKRGKVPANLSLNCVSGSVYRAISGSNLNLNELRLIKSPSVYFPKSLICDVSKKENVIIYAARFISRKNADLFIDAIELCEECMSGWAVRLYGRGPLGEHLSRRCSALSSRIDIKVGYTSDLVSELKFSKIYVTLIEPDNVPSQALFEAMETGNAVIALNSGDTSQAFQCGGAVIVEKSADDVAKAIKRLVSYPDSLRSLAAEAPVSLEKFASAQRYMEHLWVLVYD